MRDKKDEWEGEVKERHVGGTDSLEVEKEWQAEEGRARRGSMAKEERVHREEGEEGTWEGTCFKL